MARKRKKAEPSKFLQAAGARLLLRTMARMAGGKAALIDLIDAEIAKRKTEEK